MSIAYTIQRVEKFISGTDVTITTSPQQIFDSSTTARTPTQFITAYDLTNNDASNTIFLLPRNPGANLTEWWREIAPLGGTLPYNDQFLGPDAAGQLWAWTLAGTASLHMEMKQ